MNLNDTHNVTSSQELQVGVTPSSSRAGQQIELFGQEAALASHSVPQGNKKAKQTKGISGRYGSGSLESAVLQSSLENRLRQQLPMDGWMKSQLIWKTKTTPSGRRLSQLAVLARRINETDYGLWPTTSARDWKDIGNLENSRYRKCGKERKDTIGRVAFYSAATTESKGSVNPQFVCWLMGFPPEWCDYAPTETLSSRKSQQNL